MSRNSEPTCQMAEFCLIVPSTSTALWTIFHRTCLLRGSDTLLWSLLRPPHPLTAVALRVPKQPSGATWLNIGAPVVSPCSLLQSLALPQGLHSFTLLLSSLPAFLYKSPRQFFRDPSSLRLSTLAPSQHSGLRGWWNWETLWEVVGKEGSWGRVSHAQPYPVL